MTVPAYGNFQIEVIGICECDCQSDAVSLGASSPLLSNIFCVRLSIVIAVITMEHYLVVFVNATKDGMCLF